MSFTFLSDVCPHEYRQSIQSLRAAEADYEEELARIMQIVQGPRREDILTNTVTYWHNVTTAEARKMIYLRRRAARLRSAFTNSIENIAREEFGFKKVGEAWVSGTLLYQLVCRLLPGEEIMRHYRPDWLNGLELDVYVPRLRLGIEYQGQQHFHAIRAWGGEKTLEELRQRDALKAQVCKKAGVSLLTFDYTEALTEDNIRRKIEFSLVAKQH